MPLDKFLSGTMEVFGTDADEMIGPHAKFIRDQQGPNEDKIVTSFNEQLEQG